MLAPEAEAGALEPFTSMLFAPDAAADGGLPPFDLVLPGPDLKSSPREALPPLSLLGDCPRGLGPLGARGDS